MSKHTPGRWMISAERYRYIRVYAHNGGIAHLDTVDGEGMANARLIAAAPDLLEALEELLSMCQRQEDFHDDGDGCMFERASAAIAKARREK